MEGTILFFVLLVTAGVLCDEAATIGERELSCGEDEFKFGDTCFWIDKGDFTWDEAVEACKGRRMSLASIHSELEQDFIFALKGGRDCWIGLTDAAKEEVWEWTDESPLDYQNWAEGQPDGGDTENCVHTWASNGE